MILFTLLVFAQAVMAFLIGTLFFDMIHFAMHKALQSKSPLLNYIGRWHSIHHRFFPADLQIRTNLAHENLFHHVLFEYFIQLIGTLCCLLFLLTPAVMFAIIAQSLLLIGVWRCRGEDWHHKSYKILHAHRGGIFVSADYHALHHIYPNKFFSGYIKILDYICGNGIELTGKRIAMTGASGALGRHMKEFLEREGATVTGLKFGVDYHYEDFDKVRPILAQADILFLCHGTKYENTQEANCDSFVKFIELFKKHHRHHIEPLEVWAVGSEIECHPIFGIKKLRPYADSKRNYAKFARAYYHDKNIQYRHLVHSAFISPMGPGLMSARFAARLTLFFIKRGFRYIPVTYTGFAFLNYFRFAFSKHRLQAIKRI